MKDVLKTIWRLANAALDSPRFLAAMMGVMAYRAHLRDESLLATVFIFTAILAATERKK